MEILGGRKWKICHPDVKPATKWVYWTKVFTGYSSIQFFHKCVHKPHQLLLWKSCMTLQGLHVNKFISRVMHFSIAKLKLHLSSKWSKIKGQEIFNLFFEYKQLESLARAMDRWWIFHRTFQSPNPSWKPPQAHLQGLLCPAGSSGFVPPPQKHSPAALSLQFPQGLSHPYPEVSAPGRIFPWIFLFPNCKQHQKQDASTELSLCHALVTHSLRRSYSRDTNPSPKTYKGHEGKAGGLEKKEQHLELLSGTAEITFIWNR